MQLILNAETDIGIQRKMSAVEQESFEEKFINKTLAEKVDDEIPSIQVESIKSDIEEDCDKNGDAETNDNIAKGDENTTNENCSEMYSKNVIEKSDDAELEIPDKCDNENSSEPSDIKIENEELEKIESVKDTDETQTEEQSNNDENECKSLNGVKQENDEEIINNSISDITEENVSNVMDTSMPESNGEVPINMEIPEEKEFETSKKPSETIENGDIISIPDEKEEESTSVVDQEMTLVEKQTETPIIEKDQSADISSDKEINVDNKVQFSIKEESEQKIKAQSPTKEIISDSNEVLKPDDVVKATIEASDKSNKQENNKIEETENKPSLTVKETKKLSLICKLSNTLDILSDEEEEPVEKESQKEPSSEKQCISIDDDDDIMLIDEESNVKEDKNIPEDSAETKIEDQESKGPPLVNKVNIEPVEDKETLDPSKDIANIEETDVEKPKDEVQSTESKPIQKPLLPVNFLKTCKKNLADMTRDELEEFCILKIVESVVDRSNLSEIKTQLKTMGQSIEEYKKKAFMLTKQNRDLQVVLKSVQEEQKKRSDLPITPLKITRSVGMQVFMTDKTAIRRKSSVPLNNTQNNANANNTPNRLNKSQTNQSPKLQKPQVNTNNSQQIPVPRLVPAVNNANSNKLQTHSPNIVTKSPVNANLPNGVKNSPPIQKPEKRPHSKMQQGNSVTVDLTDDEPPTKMLQRNVNPPVRLVSPQNLLAPQRQPFGTNINSPRKVYIPISGSQNQVRPGQTIMLKPVNPPGTRPRLPSILPKTSGPTNSVRMTRINARHPAPLPDSMKQYQPPNWKSLPPAPELKLSKVENGIVISWKIDGYQEDNHEEIASYQLYAYQETSSPPSTALWKKIGDVKALPLPMACTLTQFMAGYKYYFAVRAVDIRSRLGPFSSPGSILLLNKM